MIRLLLPAANIDGIEAEFQLMIYMSEPGDLEHHSGPAAVFGLSMLFNLLDWLEHGRPPESYPDSSIAFETVDKRVRDILEHEAWRSGLPTAFGPEEIARRLEMFELCAEYVGRTIAEIGAELVAGMPEEYRPQIQQIWTQRFP